MNNPNHIVPSAVISAIARVADLTPSQQLRVANWLLDHNVRFVSTDIAVVPMTHGIPTEVFSAVKDLCLADKRIQAIKELRSWAIAHADAQSFQELGTLKGAKDFIDEHFARPIMPSQS